MLSQTMYPKKLLQLMIRIHLGWQNLLSGENSICKTFQNSSNNLTEYNTVQHAIIEVSDSIYEKKNDYYNVLGKKLPLRTTSAKTYWSILKTCYTKKVPKIPPILIENNLETDLLKKAYYFNKSFASKCTPLSNASFLPSLLDLETEARLTSINFSDNDKLKIMRSLDINKVHVHNDISVKIRGIAHK